ncbi:MAG TPA: stage II sporulation protein E [Bacilli bacterium]
MLKKNEMIIPAAAAESKRFWRKWRAKWRGTNAGALLPRLSAQASTILLVGMAVLLGRAAILDGLNPFAVSYFAVVYFLRKDLLMWIAAGLLIGNLLSPAAQAGSLLSQFAVMLLIQWALEKFDRTELAYAPVIVFIASFSVQLFGILAQDNFAWYDLTMAAVEAVLSFMLTLVFIQALPAFILAKKSGQWRHEELICLIILLASAMTGAIGWSISGLAVEHLLTRAFILIFALLGGVTLGTTVGVISGLVISLADVSAIGQMGLLAFAGMLAGLLKEGGKWAVAFGFFLGSSILSIYLGTQAEVLQSSWESLAAAAFFLLVPKFWLSKAALFVPGTQEHIRYQYEYAKRVRDVTANRVEQFSEVFRQLSGSFRQVAGDSAARKEEFGEFLKAVTANTCATCWKREACWEKKFYQTYEMMNEMMAALEENEHFAHRDIPQNWKRLCAKTEKVLDAMKAQLEQQKYDWTLKKQIIDSRKLVAEQLSGVSQVMEDLAKEIKREGMELVQQEETIRQALEQLGLSIHSIDIISLDEGNVEIEIVHQFNKGYDECRKIIAPLLSDILAENIAVKSEQFLAKGDGYYRVVFGSAKEFEVETGIAGAAKGGGLLSGDSFSAAELGNGKYAVAISDGMGNGERARAESSAALSILQQLLKTGMDEKLAVKSVNSVLTLRSPDEMFATIDVALIDLYTADTTFMKIGSIPSFIKRGDDVLTVTANNLPVGILQEIDVELVTIRLYPEDLLIMITDGIYDAPGPTVNKELWLKRLIQEIRAEAPQDIADCLLEKVVRYHQGEIRDDMTVVVARIAKKHPEWATIRWSGHKSFERPRTVS